MTSAEGFSWRAPFQARSSQDTEDDVRTVLAKLEAQGVDLPIVRLLANAPALFRPFVLLADGLMRRSSLDPRTRELVVLRLAGLNRCDYELAEHRVFAARAGVTEDEIARLLADGAADHGSWSEAERAALRFAEALATGGAPSDSDWAFLHEQWGSEAVLELIVAVAWWGAFVPTVIRALDLHPTDARDVGTPAGPQGGST